MDVNTTQDYSILAIDYGTIRVGLAITHVVAGLPRPYMTLQNDESLFDELLNIIKRENIGQLVVGIPIAPNGGETDQTRVSKGFATDLMTRVNQPVATVDEAMSSVEAEAMLPKHNTDKALVDAYAAAIILQRYLDERNYV